MLAMQEPLISTNAEVAVSVNDIIALDVTIDDIRKGKRCKANECAIALAARRLFPNHYIRVGKSLRLWTNESAFQRWFNELQPEFREEPIKFSLGEIGEKFRDEFDDAKPNLQPQTLVLLRLS